MLIIGGSTASGKSALAIEIAKKFNGEIISADSMQIYKKMDIGTAKIQKEEMQGIPHYLIDIIEPYEEFSVADFASLAKPLIEEIKSRGKLPVITGGTGLYINSLIYDYKLSDRDLELRKQFYLEYEEHGADYMYEKLKKIDSVSAEKTHKNNIKRVIRFLEIYYTENKPVSEKKDKQNQIPHLLYAIDFERQVLYQRINERVDRMIGEGLLNEVKFLLNSGLDFSYQSMQGIGYKEFKDYFNDDADLEKIIELIKQHTRNYAKRQQTWFRRLKTCKWLKSSNLADNLEVIGKDITESNII